MQVGGWVHRRLILPMLISFTPLINEADEIIDFKKMLIEYCKSKRGGISCSGLLPSKWYAKMLLIILIPLWKIADDKVIQKNGIKSNLTQVKLYCVMKWVHWNNLIEPHQFENRKYVKIKRCRIFFLSGCSNWNSRWQLVSNWKKVQPFQEVAVNLKSITIKILATKKESILSLHFISRRCASVWCLIILMFGKYL